MSTTHRWGRLRSSPIWPPSATTTAALSSAGPRTWRPWGDGTCRWLVVMSVSVMGTRMLVVGMLVTGMLVTVVGMVIRESVHHHFPIKLGGLFCSTLLWRVFIIIFP